MKKNLIKSKRFFYAMALILVMATLNACALKTDDEREEAEENAVTEIQEMDSAAPEGTLKGNFLIASKMIVSGDFIGQVTDNSEFTEGFRNIRMICDEAKTMELLEKGIKNLDITKEEPDFMEIFGLRWDMSADCYEETGCSIEALQKDFLPEESGLYELEVVAADLYGNASVAKVYVLYEQETTTLSEFKCYVEEVSAKVKEQQENNIQPAASGLNRTMAEEAFGKVNEQRLANGVSALVWDEALYELAGVRAQELVSDFSHERPDGSYVGDVIIRQYGASGCGENIAANYRSTTNLVNGWMNSQGHKENMLNDRFTAGVMACYCHDGSYYWVNLFRQ